MTQRLARLVLLGGLTAATLGMALVAFGVVMSSLFFPGTYLLVAGVLATGAGALMHLGRNQA